MVLLFEKCIWPLNGFIIEVWTYLISSHVMYNLLELSIFYSGICHIVGFLFNVYLLFTKRLLGDCFLNIFKVSGPFRFLIIWLIDFFFSCLEERKVWCFSMMRISFQLIGANRPIVIPFTHWKREYERGC